MKLIPIKLLQWMLLAVLIGFCPPSFSADANLQGFSPVAKAFDNSSLRGTYYIQCASEGAPYRASGMGKAYFDGLGNVELMQHDVYIDRGMDNGGITQIVDNGFVLDKDGHPTTTQAHRYGTYLVDADGFGKITWVPMSSQDKPPIDASLMITQAHGSRATAVYLVIPNGVQGVLIHVVASLR